MTDDERTSDNRTTGGSEESVQESAERRSREMAEHAEHASRELDERFAELDYPVSSEELATEYSNESIDLANETESLGSVFDRLVDEQYESPEEVREAVYNDITGDAAGMEEYNLERDLESFEEDSEEPGAR